MNNEVSEGLKQYFEETDIQFQLVPPRMNWVNYKEQAVSVFKNHFIDALFTLDSHFPFYLLGRLLTQVTMTLNMLRQSRLNPGLT